MSFKAKKEAAEIEADVALFYREDSYFDRGTELIFCDCKTYRRFNKKDIDKMRVLANEFPGSILVFATLNGELTVAEKGLLRTLVKVCNKYHERDRPKNPVMVLTSNELLAHARPPYCWKDKGGKYETFANNSRIHGLLDVCQATQAIYLGTEAWWKGWEREWKRRAAKRAL